MSFKPLRKLSWEHHDAVRFAYNINRGLNLDVDLRQVRGYAVNIAENFLEPHFEVEESSLIARLNKEQSCHQAVVEVLRQHREFHQLKLQLQQAPEPELRPLLEHFEELLKAHVLLEEKEFFPFIEEVLDDEQLLQAEREIDVGPVIDCSSWPDPYWKTKF